MKQATLNESPAFLFEVAICNLKGQEQESEAPKARNIIARASAELARRVAPGY